MSTSIPALYPGTCPECGGRWAEGDPIRTPDGWRHFWGTPPWRHDVCPDDTTDPTTLRPGETVCTRCFLVHPPGTCDR